MKLTLLLGTTGFAVVGLGIAEASLALMAQGAPGGALDATVRTWWPVIMTAGMGLVGYGRLAERQRSYETTQKEQKKSTEALSNKMDDAVTRLARIEGRLSPGALDA